MANRYDHPDDSRAGSGDCPYAWISEWLCEYVDGTMDPSMQAIFEEYMEANPELADHVERLCHTRALLSECECRQQAASGRAKARLHEATSGDEDEASEHAERNGSCDDHAAEIEAQIKKMLAEEAASSENAGHADAGNALLEGEAAHPSAVPFPQSTGAVVAAASAMTLMLGVGFVAGAVLFATPSSRSASTRPTATEQAAPDRAPASPGPGRALPRRMSSASASMGAASSSWAAPPLPLKKMPTDTPLDTAAATSAPSSSPLLLQQAGFNP